MECALFDRNQPWAPVGDRTDYDCDVDFLYIHTYLLCMRFANK